MTIRDELFVQAWSKITDADSILLACHERPDGDTLGSALGLAHVLRGLGKDVTVVSTDGVPPNYLFIPESDSILARSDRRGFDLGLILDCESLKRVGGSAEAIHSAKLTGCIDHHMPDGEFGDVRIVDHYSASTAELMAEVLDIVGIVPDQVAATQLLTGLIADTGAFRFSNTSTKTFAVAARLTDAGADPSAIAKQIFDTRPLASIKLLGRALCSLMTDSSNRVVWGEITALDLKDLEATDADTDSIVNYVGIVKGPEVYILFREIKPAEIRVSLRSRGRTDVNQVARAFGGGGHAAAAGCTLNTTLAEAKSQVVGEVLRWMES